MAPKQIVPALGLDSFSCPHCGAIAQQSWFKLCLSAYPHGKKPDIERYDQAAHIRIKNTAANSAEDAARRKRLADYLDRLEKNFATYRTLEYSTSGSAEMVNLVVSLCYSCGGFGIWIGDELIYPDSEIALVPHEEMPQAVLRDFTEAASIVAKSPRAAAALLRLCVQRLVVELGEKGDNLNADIGSLVQKDMISPAVQKALDVVRVVGNNAVHPGEISFDDDGGIATKLFGLVNVIVEAAIATPKHIQKMYESVVPPDTQKAIENRDTKRP